MCFLQKNQTSKIEEKTYIFSPNSRSTAPPKKTHQHQQTKHQQHTNTQTNRSEGFPWTGIFRPCVRWLREVGRFRALFTYPRVRISVLGRWNLKNIKQKYTFGTNAFKKRSKNIYVEPWEQLLLENNTFLKVFVQRKLLFNVFKVSITFGR